MRSPLQTLSRPRLRASLMEDWGLDGVDCEYLPVGGGSYHWLVRDPAGKRCFVTVDDLDQKPFLGKTRDSAFDGLRHALDTARALRREAELEFVVAPLTTLSGETVQRIGAQHAAAVYPSVSGRPGRFGEVLPPAERTALVRMLVRLHQATAPAAPHVRPASASLPGRDDLQVALRDLEHEWSGGPFSEPARALLSRRAHWVRRLLERFDRLAAAVDPAAGEAVLTHGEPHPANLIRAGEQLLLIDWDTVGLARPERDLWMVDTGTGNELALYSRESGRSLDAAALAFYRMRWGLDDMSIALRTFRSPHRRTEDTERAWLGLVKYLESEAIRT